jgi:hypothetical protein
MIRDEWVFPYTADKLLEAARAKSEFHTGRKEWWTKKRAEVEQQIKTDGIKIDTSVAEQVGKSYTNMDRNASVTVDNRLVKDFQETVGKIEEHRNKVSQYDAWIEVLQSQGQTSFALHQDDWLFFFGKQ